MNLAPYFNSAEKKLNGLSRIEKLQLYTIPVFIVIFLLYNFTNIEAQAYLKPKTKLEQNDVNAYAFLQHLQEFAKKKSLSIINLKQNGLNFSITAEGEFQNIVEFIFFCETYQSVNTIENIKVSYQEQKSHLYIQFAFSPHKYVLSESEKKRGESMIVSNPFMPDNGANKENLVLNAIINHEALINNIWLRQGDVIGEYEILNIQARFVELQQHNKEIIILKLLKE